MSDAGVIGWAVKRRGGTVVVEIGAEVTEATVWNIALGWPSDDEITAEKAAGGFAYPCRVVPR